MEAVIRIWASFPRCMRAWDRVGVILMEKCCDLSKLGGREMFGIHSGYLSEDDVEWAVEHTSLGSRRVQVEDVILLIIRT